jgi:chitin disaccharide deacetylase
MGSASSHRRLVVNADDFGRDASVNEAVRRACREGILTTASLMVNGDAFNEAVEIAREFPQLGVGLHLCLLKGRSELKPTDIPGLVDEYFYFSDHPVRTGIRYFFHPGLKRQLFQEIDAQVARFRGTRLRMDHLNGHLNIHLHPTVFALLIRHARKWGIEGIRLTRDPFWLNARLAPGRWGYRTSHAAIFSVLSWWARSSLHRHGIRHTRSVFGLLQSGQMDEDYLSRLLPQLPAGDSEVYLHPCRQQSPAELAALLSPRIRELIRQHDIRLLRYQDL